MSELIESLREELNKSDINKDNCLDILYRIESQLWEMEDYSLELESKINKLQEKYEDYE